FPYTTLFRSKILNFVPDPKRMIVGTDSLASNDTLDILAELKVISAHTNQLDFLQILPWATINGAEALGVAHQFGFFEEGKTPGILWLEVMNYMSLKAIDTL